MKRTDLEKLKGVSITDRINKAGTPGRFGKDAATALNRREQRKLDQAQGLVPFAVKLNGDLIKQIHARAAERGAGLNETVAELLEKGLGS